MHDHVLNNQADSCMLAVIGGGAAGMAAALSAAAACHELDENRRRQIREHYGLGHQLKILILEKQDRVGRKILVTGNGRCNITNRFLDLDRYHGRSVTFAQGALQRFGLDATLDWFRQMGLPCREDSGGRIFPNSLQAASVLDILRLEIERLGIVTRTGFSVEKINRCQPLYLGNQPLRQEDGFEIISRDGQIIKAALVIVATGGLAAPALGCDGSGYRLLSPWGHHLIPPHPAIVQIKTEENWTRGLAGSKFEGTVSILRSRQTVRSETGEILFTQYGLSGPPVLQLGRIAAQAAEEKNTEPLVVELDFLPDWKWDECLMWLTARQKQHPQRALADFLVGLIARKISQSLLKQALEQPLSQTCAHLSDQDLHRIVQALKQTRLTVQGTLGWDQAQVTAGGLDVREFRPDTCESKLQPGLFAAGEILDIDGDCGGYNLQWAWSSGYLAGSRSIRRAVKTVKANREERPRRSQK